MIDDKEFPQRGLLAWVLTALFIGFLVSIFVLKSACSDDAVACFDHQQCVTTADGVRVLRPGEHLEGECVPGILDCVTEACIGFIGPDPEICDGLDNDCNGSIDDAVFEFEDACPVTECGVCSNPTPVCRNGEIVCDSFPRTEVCNGLDDDCDCEVDEIPLVLSYSGPPETLGFGECAPAVISCRDGQVVNLPEILPEAEICDGLDNDCNGIVDDLGALADPRSVLLALDYSSSMDIEYRRLLVIDKVCDVAQIAPNGFYMAIVAFGLTPPADVQLVSDFVTASEACTVLRNTNLPGGGMEHQPQAVMSGLGSTIWPTDNRLVIVASDEWIQEDLYTLNDVSAACIQEDFDLLVMTLGSFEVDWLPTVSICGGDIIRFSSSMAEQLLVTALTDVCAR